MLLAFDDFVFDEEQGELRKANTLLKVDAKVLELLAFFLKHSGKLVSKHELFDQVWEGRVLSEKVLSVSVARLRKALGHKRGEREYIVNVIGRGYRFLPQVTSIESNQITTVLTSRPPQSSAELSPLVRRGSVMQRLDSALARARAGTGCICMLVGEPGIGKTRVAEALEERSAASDARWAWARCHSMESDPPLWLWTQILREHLNTVTVHGSDKPAAKSPVKPSTPAGPTRSVLPVHDSSDRGGTKVLRDELAVVASICTYPREQLRFIVPYG